MTDKSKRLTPAEWAEIITLYERGEATQRQLAERFGVTRQAIGMGLRERNIVMGSKADDIVNEVREASEKARRQKIEDIAALKRRYIKINDMLSGVAMNRISEALKPGGIGLAALHPELMSIKTAAAIFNKTRDESYILYDVDKMEDESDDLPELGISTYTDEEIEQLRKANDETYNEHSFGDEDDDDAED